MRCYRAPTLLKNPTGRRGFEPRSTESESAILPIRRSPNFKQPEPPVGVEPTSCRLRDCCCILGATTAYSKASDGTRTHSLQFGGLARIRLRLTRASGD